MPSLSQTFARFAAQASAAPALSSGTDRLSDMFDFGSNPGNLLARHYVPAGLGSGAPLVVVLHGCSQTAAGYDHGSGWSTLADRHGFAVLFPEQQAANNPNRCFTWFGAQDIARDQGETLSIRQMIARMISDHAIDATQVFVTGLSAGGAMTMVMLATYPELFAGGAVIAGLPYGTALSTGDALQRMRGIRLPDGPALVDVARIAAPKPEKWPTLSVWHGTADHTVVPANMEAIVAQWAGLQGIVLEAAQADRVDGQAHRRWVDANSTTQIETYTIAGLAHGTPIDPTGPDGCGAAMPYMLPAGINSTRRIAEGWGIASTASAAEAAPRLAPPPPQRAPLKPVLAATSNVAKVIEDTLRAAGLMR